MARLIIPRSSCGVASPTLVGPEFATGMPSTTPPTTKDFSCTLLALLLGTRLANVWIVCRKNEQSQLCG